MERENLAEGAKIILKDHPAHHGWEHGDLVATYSEILAFFEGQRTGPVKAIGLLHDVFKGEDEELQQRGLSVGWGTSESGVKIEGVLRDHVGELFKGCGDDFWEHFKAYRDALVAFRILGASKKQRDWDKDHVSEGVKTSRLERKATKIVASADKLARTDYPGLTSILEAGKGEIPFYNEGDEIVRPKDAPIIPYREIKSCVNDINSCTGDWEKMMETSTGKLLMLLLDRVNHKFLEIFSQNTEIGDYDIWIGWLKSILDSQKEERATAKCFFEKGQYSEFLRITIKLADPELLNQESLNNYLASDRATGATGRE